MKDILLGCVGKPSAGKSSFLNAATDAKAKVGNYPFTTIEPNMAVTFYTIDCPCAKVGKSEFCKPRYGNCINGRRRVPIRCMDVAGLVPGAAQGAGLGNQFLDSLRLADAFIHVVDVSGTTDAMGRETKGFDPIKDIDWFRSEVHDWVYNNLVRDGKWQSLVRRHIATKSSTAETLQLQLSGYGATMSVVNKTLDKLSISKSLDQWDVNEDLHKFVDTFLDTKFKTVVALNKCDLPDSDRNIIRMMKKYGDENFCVTSALAELYLRRLSTDGFIYYQEGTDIIYTKDEAAEAPELKSEIAAKLKRLDPKQAKRLETVRDLVVYRYGSTGISEAVTKAVLSLNVIPVFPVKNITNFGYLKSDPVVFRDCMMVWPGTTVGEVARMLSPEIAKYLVSCETVGGVQVSEGDKITLDNNILCFKTSQNIKISTFDLPVK